ncbi:hypothetical protein O181_015931 [Austropuccinia psidii MF-1]|uniref:PCI domain-containing protein n=1 Tax=Austropuccinia psidii MF-1 TaxID=1389203 RepID=A0A9Q3GQK1_9BASI|nr:hypothetical protein [Austropuccinia psidii MF-1]
MRAFVTQKRTQESTLDVADLSLEQLINRFSYYFRHQHQAIAELVRPNDWNLIRSLKSIIVSSRVDRFESVVQRQFNEDSTLADFVSNYLCYVRSVEFEGFSNGLDICNGTQSLLAATHINHSKNFDLLLSVYNPATNIFRRPDAAFFTQSIQLLSHALVQFAILADRQRGSNKNEKTSEAARQMTTTLGMACIDRSTEEPNKRRAAFSLANGLFKIYFFLKNMRLCDTVIKNTSNVINQLETHYPKSELVTFHYYLGRMALYQRRLHKARDSLKRAFDLCKSDSWKNRRLILIYLIAASLPLGILPKSALIDHFCLGVQFGRLVENLKVGNWPCVVAALDGQRDWFRFKGIYILLREKLEVICWRNFFVIMANLKNERPGMRLSLTRSVEPARKVFMEESIDEHDVVCMASSLIDQGYLKAYVKLGEMIVFGSTLPRISSVGEHMNESGVTSVPQLAQPMNSQSSIDRAVRPRNFKQGFFHSREMNKVNQTRRFG